MSVTWSDAQAKMQRIARDNTDGTLGQLQQDYNTGYHLFNAKLARYYTREQQFTDLIAQQSIYQTPVDCLRITGMTALVGGNSTYSWPLKEVSSEYQWRQMTSYVYANNWPTWYMTLGNDKFQLWPIPSQDVTNGLRLYYQPQDYDLSVNDYVSGTPSTFQTQLNATVTVTNGSTEVTASASVFTPQMVGLWFQVTGVTNLTFYEISAVPDATTLTLKSAFTGTSGASQQFRIGQQSIIPQEYVDAPMYYSLGNYFDSKGNENRAAYFRNLFEKMQQDCEEEYSSSQTGSVITDNGISLNPWVWPSVPGPSP